MFIISEEEQMCSQKNTLDCEAYSSREQGLMSLGINQKWDMKDRLVVGTEMDKRFYEGNDT